MRKERQRANEEQALYKNQRPELGRAEPQPASDPRPGKAAIKHRVLLALFHRATLTGGPANQRASGVGAGLRFIRFFEVTVWPLSPCGGTPRPRGFREILVPSDRFRIGTPSLDPRAYST